MQPDRVRAVGRTGAEDSSLGLRDIITGMDAKDVATGAIELGEDYDPVTWAEIPESVDEIRFEHGCALLIWPHLGP